MAERETVYAYQDGNAFYIFTTQEEPRSVDSVMTWKFAVKDFDMVAARKARAWFLEIAHGMGWNVVWE